VFDSIFDEIDDLLMVGYRCNIERSCSEWFGRDIFGVYEVNKTVYEYW
jgi:hypothetical protein